MAASKHHMAEVSQYLPLNRHDPDISKCTSLRPCFLRIYVFAGMVFFSSILGFCEPSLSLTFPPKPFNIILPAFVPADSVCLGLPAHILSGTMSYSFHNLSSTGLVCDKDKYLSQVRERTGWREEASLEVITAIVGE